MPTAIKTYDDLMALPTGEQFSIRLTKTMTWKELHGVLYRTANREVTLTLRSGEKVTGTLNESPGYFAADNRVWLRVPGRKTRKGIKPREVRHLVGFKAPTLAEALTAFIYLNASNPTDEQIREARNTSAQM